MDCEPRFFADVMLGTLAKWLRILGYDTAYDNRITDSVLAKRCLAEDRVALTRDTRLVKRRILRGRSLLVQEEDLFGQLQEVMSALGENPNPQKILTRCLDCNSPLVTVQRESVESDIPPYVYSTHREFKRCPECRKVYWKGTHRENILKSLFPTARSVGPET